MMARAKKIEERRRFFLGALPVCLLAALASSAGCQRVPPPPPPQQELPPAYTSNQITDPALRRIEEEIRDLVAKQIGAGGMPLFSRTEVLVPARTVQPYGVGAFQQELRLPVILTTGLGWARLKRDDKEAKVAQTFNAISAKLETLKRQPPLWPTLTIQTPQGMELAWINHLDASGKNLHGDE
jgi:hypothetical protein